MSCWLSVSALSSDSEVVKKTFEPSSEAPSKLALNGPLPPVAPMETSVVVPPVPAGGPGGGGRRAPARPHRGVEGVGGPGGEEPLFGLEKDAAAVLGSAPEGRGKGAVPAIRAGRDERRRVAGACIDVERV